jgi:hypothetical protein
VQGHEDDDSPECQERQNCDYGSPTEEAIEVASISVKIAVPFPSHALSFQELFPISDYDHDYAYDNEYHEEAEEFEVEHQSLNTPFTDLSSHLSKAGLAFTGFSV